MRVNLLLLGSLINGNASSNDAHAKVSLVGPAGSGAVAANADNNSNIAMVSPTHYAVPKANAIGASGPATKIRIQLVPDFHQGKHDMGELLFHCQKKEFLEVSGFPSLIRKISFHC